jgi:hypothetical protein
VCAKSAERRVARSVRQGTGPLATRSLGRWSQSPPAPIAKRARLPGLRSGGSPRSPCCRDAPSLERCPSAVLRSECDRCATACRIYLPGRTFPTDIELPSGDDQQEGWGYVILCNVLSGPGYRLRATGEIDDVIGDGCLLPRLGAALAQARRTRPTDERRFRRRKPSNRANEPSVTR